MFLETKRGAFLMFTIRFIADFPPLSSQCRYPTVRYMLIICLVSWKSSREHFHHRRLTYCSAFCTFPFPSIFVFTFSHALCSSPCPPTAYPICPVSLSRLSLPAGSVQRLPKKGTGVATHTPLSMQIPVAASRQRHKYTTKHRQKSHTKFLLAGMKMQEMRKTKWLK